MRCISYRINKDNIITGVNDGWNSFAASNRAENLSGSKVTNRYLNDFISDPQTRHIYKLLISRSRENHEVIRFAFRCDSPEKRRFMSMELRPLEDGAIELCSCIEREEEREPLGLLNTDLERSEDYLTICSWCKKIRTGEVSWVEAEEAIDVLGLFGENRLPQLTHGICPNCVKEFEVREGLA